MLENDDFELHNGPLLNNGGTVNEAFKNENPEEVELSKWEPLTGISFSNDNNASELSKDNDSNDADESDNSMDFDHRELLKTDSIKLVDHEHESSWTFFLQVAV